MRVSSSNGLRLRGLRLLDYAHTQNHKLISYPRPDRLLQASVGRKYGHVEHNLESATLLLHNLNSSQPSKEVAERLNVNFDLERRRLQANDGQSSVLQLVSKSGYTLDDVQAWTRCFEAATMTDAIAAMSHVAKWPDFLLIYTLHRECRSPLEAYEAIRVLYQLQIAQVRPKYQAEVTVLAIKLAQHYLVDLAPAIVRIFITQASIEAKTATVYSELLWTLAKFGTYWSSGDCQVLMQAQRLIIDASGAKSGIKKVKVKGTVAIAYLGHFATPELANRLVENLPDFNEGSFAKKSGKYAIKLLTTQSATESLGLMESLGDVHDTPFMWGILAFGLRNNGLLTPDLAMRLWSFVMSSKHRIGGLLAETIIQALPDWSRKSKVVHDLKIIGMKISPRIAKSLVPSSSADDLDKFLHDLPELAPGAEALPPVLEAVLRSQSFLDNAKAWKTYQQLVKIQKVPSRSALQALCQAAWSPNVMWNGMYAPQRALAEIRMWVRGAQTPADDLLRVYPDEGLLYAYVYMCGRAGYVNELTGFLDWLDRLRFKPTKRLLLALIDVSPQGPALLKLGQRSRESGDDIEWPTEDDLELYRQQR